MPDSSARSEPSRARPATRRRHTRRRPMASPLEVQLAIMNALFEAAHDEAGKIARLDLARQACDIAKLAAPYVHARLGPAEPPPPEGRVRHEDLLDRLD